LPQEFIALQKTTIRATTFKRTRIAKSDVERPLWAHRVNSDACLKWLLSIATKLLRRSEMTQVPLTDIARSVGN